MVLRSLRNYIFFFLSQKETKIEDKSNALFNMNTMNITEPEYGKINILKIKNTKIILRRKFCIKKLICKLSGKRK